MSQIALPLVWPTDASSQDFIATAANHAVIRHLAHWSLWPVMATILTGPRKSGRSLIARRFAHEAQGQLIDDAERKPEEAIFHAWNRAQTERRPLLIVADAAPPEWAIALPDLRSRLAATPRIVMAEPDDALIAAVLERDLAARGLAPSPEVVVWLGRRIGRRHLDVQRTIDALDDAALAERARLTVPFARRVLKKAGVIDDSSM